MSLLIVLMMALGWAIALRCYGPFSFVTAGVFCFSVYSLPAALGLVFPFEQMLPLALAPAAPGALAVTAFAWAVFCIVIAVPVGTRRPALCLLPTFAPKTADLSPFIWAALAASVLGYCVLAATQGPLYFLAARDELHESFVSTLWRWVNAVGLCAALMARSRGAATVFITGLVIHFLAGDRTVLVITACCILVVYGRGKSFTKVLKLRVLIPLLIVGTLALVGKPIYLAAKSGSAAFLFHAATSEWVETAMATFEPFITFNILSLVVSRDFSMPVGTTLEGILGQALVIPSLFGIDSNSFNAEFTKLYAANLAYGVAGNYWAHAWSLGGAVGVAVFATIYGVTLRLCDRCARQRQGSSKIFFSLIGALFAAYIHRNSLDNLLSFVRQIVLVMLLLMGAARVLRPFFESSPRELQPACGTSDIRGLS